MGYSNVAGDLNVAATTTLSTLVVNGSTQHYGPITSTSTAAFANLVASNLIVTGNFSVTATNTAVSNSLSIVNQGTKTALYVNQNEFPNMTYNVAEFWDHTQLAMVIDGYGNVAIHTGASSAYALTVVDGASIDKLTLGSPLAISSGGTGTDSGATPNQVFAGPSIGSAGPPLFRALVNADLPSIISVSNVYANGSGLSALNSSNLVGNVANANVALVVSQPAQSNITSVGTLTGLTVSGLLIASNASGLSNLNSSNLVGNVANANVALVVSQPAQSNITSVGTLTGLNVQGLLIASNGSGISNLNSSNLVGNVANANVALVVSQGAQPNITSVGTLSNLVVSNSVTTTNVFANTLTMANATSTINVTGNLYTGNAVTTTNLFTAGFTSNATNTNFNYDTVTIPFVYSTTLNVLSTSNVLTQSVVGSSGLTSLYVSGNVYTSNALTTVNLFANTLTLANSTSTINVLGSVTATTFYGSVAGSNIGAFSNLYSANALVTTNLFTNTLTLANSTSTINVLGSVTATTFYGSVAGSNVGSFSNLYAANALVTTNLFANTLTLANATSTINVLGSVTATTFYGAYAGSNIGAFSNLYSANALVTTNLFANTLVLSNAFAGNIYASNALVTTNLFANTLTLANSTSTINVLGSVTATTFYGAHAGSNVGAFSNLYSANALVTTNLFANTLVLSNAFAGNIYASNALSTGNVFLTGSINVQGSANISFANIANIYTQNVTALGTNLVLSSLVVNGNVYVSNTTTGANGFYSIGTYGGVYSDGIVMDYVQGTVGNGRLSVGANDSLTFYTGGPSGTAMVYFDPNLRVGLGTTTPGSNLHVIGNVYASNAVTTGSIIATGISNIATANITTLYTPNFVAGAAGVFLNLYSTYTLTSATSWTGNVSGTVTPNLYTLFVAPYSVSTGQWNSYGTSSLVSAPTANGGIRFNQPGPYMITAIISLDSGVKTIAVSSNTGNTVDIHSNVTNVWTYCYRSPLGDVNPWPVTIPVNVTNTSQYYYLDIEANNQTDNIRQTAYANTSTQAYTGSYVIIRPV